MATQTDVTLQNHAAFMRKLAAGQQASAQQLSVLQQMVANISSRPRSVTEEIDSIPGRRIESALVGEVTFTATDLGSRGKPITMQVSQDGPFVMTHYPMALWRPTAPSNTTNLNRWRPVSSDLLPTQQVTTDFIDIMYELQDGGAQRLFQNEPRGPMLSRPDNLIPCPVPTIWSPNAAVLFIPTYLALTWNSEVQPTEGTLHVDIPGYRIVNL